MITEILFYYLTFCIATTLVTLIRGVHPTVKERDLHWQYKLGIYAGTLFIALLLAPVFFFIIVFYPKIYREALNNTLDEHFNG